VVRTLPAEVRSLAPHEHWHIEFSYLNIGGTFYFLCCVLDGCSRAVLAWDIRPAMREIDVQIVVQKAREAQPEARPRIISDQGSQFQSREFKAFITQWQAIRPKTPQTLEEAKRITGDFIYYSNTQRLHSAIGYITPADRLDGRQNEIHAAREHRRIARQTITLTHQKTKTSTTPAVA